jgi:hypothetical protein
MLAVLDPSISKPDTYALWMSLISLESDADPNDFGLDADLTHSGTNADLIECHVLRHLLGCWNLDVMLILQL